MISQAQKTRPASTTDDQKLTENVENVDIEEDLSQMSRALSKSNNQHNLVELSLLSFFCTWQKYQDNV